MRALGLVLIVVILVVGFVAGRPGQPELVDGGDPALSQGLSPDRASRRAGNSPCRTSGDGFLEASRVFGDGRASHIHVNYWLAGDGVEWDVMLPGGSWQSADAVGGGRFWVYHGCADAQVREQVALHQARRGAQHAGWGDPALFRRPA